MPKRKKFVHKKSKANKSDIFPVECLIDKRVTEKNEVEYLVSWQGYSPSHNSWEPEINISPALIREYNAAELEQETSDSDSLYIPSDETNESAVSNTSSILIESTDSNASSAESSDNFDDSRPGSINSTQDLFNNFQKYANDIIVTDVEVDGVTVTFREYLSVSSFKKTVMKNAATETDPR